MKECIFHVPLCGSQLSMEGKKRVWLKIASFGSVICWRSAYGGYMWLFKLAAAGRGGLDKDRTGARGGFRLMWRGEAMRSGQRESQAVKLEWKV